MRVRGSSFVLGVVCAVGLGACASHVENAGSNDAMPPAIAANGMMVDRIRQMALYTYEGDGPNRSCCTGTCATEWPPLYAQETDANRGDFSVFRRADGRKQWALMGRPLYFWSNDANPGDAAGEANSAKWRVFRVSDYAPGGQFADETPAAEC